jgi:hypothetical protein
MELMMLSEMRCSWSAAQIITLIALATLLYLCYFTKFGVKKE